MAWLIMMIAIVFVAIGITALHAEHDIKTTTGLVEIAIMALVGFLLSMAAFAHL